MAVRQKGRKMDPEVRARKSMKGIIDMIMQFIRTDFGGRDQITVTAKKAREFAKKNGKNLSEEGSELVAAFAIELATHAMDGARKRVLSPVDDLRRRNVLLVTVLSRVADMVALQDEGSLSPSLLKGVQRDLKKIVDGGDDSASFLL